MNRLPELTDEEQALLLAMQNGLPIIARPYRRLADDAGLSEDRVLAILNGWRRSGLIKRLGLVVHHRRLGYTANAMVVWDIPDCDVERRATLLIQHPAVTLCYRRRRHPPQWLYNLYCMIHGKDRAKVLATIADINRFHGLDYYPHEVLFSTRQFKQRGARYQLKVH